MNFKSARIETKGIEKNNKFLNRVHLFHFTNCITLCNYKLVLVCPGKLGFELQHFTGHDQSKIMLNV